MISGIIASPGIAFGKALLVRENKVLVSKGKIPPKEIDAEIERFINARAQSLIDLQNVKTKAGTILNKDNESIFESHIMLLEDEELEREIIQLIKQNLFPAERAIILAIKNQEQVLEKLENEYLRERAADIRDVGKRILKNLSNVKDDYLSGIGPIWHESILVVRDLSPSEIIQLDFKKILGFITDVGGKTSHTSIIARSLEIPAIVGTTVITDSVNNGDYLILDAINNRIYINPTDKEIDTLKSIQDEFLKKKKNLINLKHLPAITRDGFKVELSANISSEHDIPSVKLNGAYGIGLYRTEFLFMNRNELPTEEEQFQIYKTIAKTMRPKTVIIRTLDIGGDKKLSYINFPKEENPSLGWRAIRMVINRKDILRTQLRAILRASVFGNLYILFPMITLLEEIFLLKEELDKIKIELCRENNTFNSSVKVGAMIETPSSAILASHLAKEVDFFSIGTNDLTQYTLAVDRNNDLVSHLYDPMSPAVLNLIKQVVEASHNEGKWTSICGELASDERAMPILLGMFVNKFSMSSFSIPKIKKIIRNLYLKNTIELTRLVLSQPTTEKIISLVNEFIENYY